MASVTESRIQSIADGNFPEGVFRNPAPARLYQEAILYDDAQITSSGGVATKRSHVYLVVLLSHIVGIIGLLGLILMFGEPLPAMSDLFRKITAPTLILKADAEGEERKKNEKVAEILKDGKIVHIEGAGHCVHRDQMKLSLASLREFLGAL